VLTHVGAGLPLRPETPAKTERKGRYGVAGRRPLVLLVEDNDINALLARRMLEKANCEVRLCVNGREAVDVMAQRLEGSGPAFDLILMDVHMPVLDGLEATRIIKGLYAGQPKGGLRAPPIVALTANAFEEDRRRCMEAGMDDYLAKPFDRDDLQQVLDRWCGDTDGARAA
jgi:CheY-like chemotaxis protein